MRRNGPKNAKKTAWTRQLRYNRQIMFAARPFDLNIAPATLAGSAACASISKTTTIIKG